MKPINLKHLVIAKQALTDALCKELVSNWGVAPKDSEYVAISSLLSELEKIDSPYEEHYLKLLDVCYFGFSIPQISKEFDCLWIGDETILNIELKSGTKPEEDLKQQLKQNQYYLKTLKKAILSFTYVSSTNACYMLNEKQELVNATIGEIAEALSFIHKQKLYSGDIENLFHPEDYLVSPFNSTEEFLKNEYFLTSQQQEIKKKVVAAIDDPNGPAFLAITGGPGSGKTLLLYDIANTFIRAGKKVIIGHAGGLNQGQQLLKTKGWDIRPTKDLFALQFDMSTLGASIVPVGDADVYLMDEAQRSPDVGWVAEEVGNKGKKCIFAFDSNQYLNNKEFQLNNEARITSLSGTKGLFRLKSSIRTNEAVCVFIDALFDRSKSVHKNVRGSVEITYCETVSQVQSTLEMLKSRGYVVPKFTPNASDYHPRNDYEDWFPLIGLSAHEIIGQEFDSVVGLISPNMFYSPDGKLVSRVNYYYIEDRMLYQILSRAKKRIHLVVFNNQAMLNRCLDLLK